MPLSNAWQENSLDQRLFCWIFSLAHLETLSRLVQIISETLASLVTRSFWRSAGMFKALSKPGVSISHAAHLHSGLRSRGVASQVIIVAYLQSFLVRFMECTGSVRLDSHFLSSALKLTAQYRF